MGDTGEQRQVCPIPSRSKIWGTRCVNQMRYYSSYKACGEKVPPLRLDSLKTQRWRQKSLSIKKSLNILQLTCPHLETEYRVRLATLKHKLLNQVMLQSRS